MENNAGMLETVEGVVKFISFDAVGIFLPGPNRLVWTRLKLASTVEVLPLSGDLAICEVSKSNPGVAQSESVKIHSFSLVRSHDQTELPKTELEIFELKINLIYCFFAGWLSLEAYNNTIDFMKSHGLDFSDICTFPSMNVSKGGLKDLRKLVTSLKRANAPKPAACLADINEFFSTRTGHGWSILRSLVEKLFPIPQQGPAKYPAEMEFKKQLPVPDWSKFATNSTQIRVYIDEAWLPGESFGIIGGIVWDGVEPDRKLLPTRDTHCSHLYYLEKDPKILTACRKSFPFIIKVEDTDYQSLLVKALKILLGWMLPQKGCACNVSIFLEALHAEGGKFGPGADWTDYYKGIISEAKETSPARFNRWLIKEVKCVAKDFEYVAWGDLLAYLGLQGTADSQAFFKLHGIDKWPGYIVANDYLIKQMQRFDSLKIDAAELINFMQKQKHSGFLSLFLEGLKDRIKNDEVLKSGIVKAVDEKFLAKDRNLNELRELLSVISSTVPDIEKNGSLRTRFSWYAVSVKSANHHGNPELAEKMVEKYRDLRSAVLENDREMVFNTDLAIAVHYNDQFDFARAMEFNSAIRNDPGFPYLSLLSRGRICSSMGQSISIVGNYEKAEKVFEEAIDYFLKADLPEAKKRGELSQTAVYRCLNAFDGNLSCRHSLFSAIFGTRKELQAALSAGNEPQNPYKLHLLLRIIYFHEDYRSLYEDYRFVEKSANSHPWELISLYRGLLENEVNSAREKCIQRLLSAYKICCLPQHGVTMNLIGLAIFLTHKKISGRAVKDNVIKDFCELLTQKLPTARSIIQKMIEYSKSDCHESEIIKLLPFYYH